MTNNKGSYTFKAMLIVSLTSLLMACGGGGSGSTTSVTPPNSGNTGGSTGGTGGTGSGNNSGGSTGNTTNFTIDVANHVSSINENSQAVFAVNYNDNDGAVVLSAQLSGDTVNQESYTLTSNDTEKTVTLSVHDLDSTKNIVLSIKATDSSGTQADTEFSLDLINNSAQALYQRLVDVADQADQLVAATEEKRLIGVLANLTYYQGAVTSAERDGYITKAESGDLVDQTKITAFKNLVQQKTQTLSVDSSDSALTSAFEEILVELTTTESNFNDTIVELNSKLSSNAIEVPVGENFYEPISGKISQFYGNETLGSVNIEGQWVFNDTHRYLTEIVTPATNCNLVK